MGAQVNMTLEEIEARWKAATPGPWAYDDEDSSVWNGAGNSLIVYTIEDVDAARAIAAAPTDIAYLLDRVRKLERAHAWFVDHFNASEKWSQCEVCGADEDFGGVHDDVCQYVKARDLKL